MCFCSDILIYIITGQKGVLTPHPRRICPMTAPRRIRIWELLCSVQSEKERKNPGDCWGFDAGLQRIYLFF